MSKKDSLIKTDIREYAEGMTVNIFFREPKAGFSPEIPDTESPGRWVVHARNEGGYNCTEVDLEDVINWLDSHL